MCIRILIIRLIVGSTAYGESIIILDAFKHGHQVALFCFYDLPVCVLNCDTKTNSQVHKKSKN